MINVDHNNQPGFQQPTYAPQYQQQAAPIVSTKEWLISMLLLIIPIVNIIMLFVWAFGSGSNPSKANYAKASLIFAVILIVLYILFFVVLFGSIIGSLGALNY